MYPRHRLQVHQTNVVKKALLGVVIIFPSKYRDDLQVFVVRHRVLTPGDRRYPLGFNHLEGNRLLVDVDANELVQVSPSFILASEEVDPLIRCFYIWVALVNI